MPPCTRTRTLIALTIALGGCAFIWIATPYNNFLLGNAFISDSYLPVAAVVFMLPLVLAINPLLARLAPRLALTVRQLALIFGLLLVASVLPGQGLLRMLPHSVARSNQDLNRDPRLAEIVTRMQPPAALFPDPLGLRLPTPACDGLSQGLPRDAPIPWRHWLRPLLSWGVFAAACFTLMVGLGMVVYPQWRHNERLAFPLLAVMRHLIGAEDEGGGLPPLFRRRSFWVGCGLVMFLYLLNGLNHHTHGKVPAFPLGWDLGPAFTEIPWRHLGNQIKRVDRIYFVLIGMAFFMQNRIAFSLWFTIVAYAVVVMIVTAYFPPVPANMIRQHSTGATIGVILMVIYLGRLHWAAVARAMFHRASGDADRFNRAGGWLFGVGALALFFWLLWVGVDPGWAAGLVLLGFMHALIIARIVAETGLPWLRITSLDPNFFQLLLPARWLTAAAIYFGGFIRLVFSLGSRVSATVMGLHALALERDDEPRRQIRLGFLFIGVLVMGLVACGAVHLRMAYRHLTSLDGLQVPLLGWGATRLEDIQGLLLAWERGSWFTSSHPTLTNIGVGATLAVGLQIACMAMPRWPLHPIGLLMMGNAYGNNAWPSIFIGWLLKTVLVRHGGAGAYRTLCPFFFGLILGEIFSAVIWTIVPVTLILLGHDPLGVGNMAIMPR